MATGLPEACDAALRLIAERVQMLTLASGAAIALREGDHMLCRARAGATAPMLGARLDTQSGLSGECVRTASTLVCHDTERDPRVNLDVCRRLGIRSIAVFPICLERDVVGVFEAFSAHAGGFSGNEVAALEGMRDLIIWAIQRGPQAESPAAPPLAARPAEVAAPAPPFHRPENRTMPPFPVQAREDNPLPATFRSTAVPGSDDDLICEIEQRAQSKPQSDTITRVSHFIQPESKPFAATRASALPASTDPDGDLICETEMRPAGPPLLLKPVPHPANILRSFTPAAQRLPEHTISRKLIVTGVVVAIAGLIWLRWCNPAQQASAGMPPLQPLARSASQCTITSEMGLSAVFIARLEGETRRLQEVLTRGHNIVGESPDQTGTMWCR